MTPLPFLLLVIASGQSFSWDTVKTSTPLAERITPPPGFKRVGVPPVSFAHWLRRLPVRTGNPKVHLYSGALKRNQSAQFAVIDIDVGKKNLQQCADAAMRLRAEYLWSAKRYDDICFRFTSGDAAWWKKWSAGVRPKIQGNRVSWSKRSKANSSYANFRKYLDIVFTYAGTYSLKKELLKLKHPSQVLAGDLFIKGGFPGHAVIVVDVVENAKGERRFLLAQSYMPAQEIHVLRQPGAVSPWYSARDKGVLATPEWTFRYSDLRRFSNSGCR